MAEGRRYLPSSHQSWNTPPKTSKIYPLLSPLLICDFLSTGSLSSKLTGFRLQSQAPIQPPQSYQRKQATAGIPALPMTMLPTVKSPNSSAWHRRLSVSWPDFFTPRSLQIYPLGGSELTSNSGSLVLREAHGNSPDKALMSQEPSHSQVPRQALGALIPFVPLIGQILIGELRPRNRSGLIKLG